MAKKKGFFTKPEPEAPVVEAPAEPVQVELPPQEKAPEIAVEIAVAEPKKYVLGFNHDKMRQQCGKCGGTQILITKTLFKEGPGGYDGKPTKIKDGFEFTCNDCKTTYQGQ